MNVCPNCNHQNPDGAIHCEACYTPLPTMTHCPNCHASVQSDASFCGQCGFNLQGHAATHEPHHPSALPPTIAVPPGEASPTSPSIPTRTPALENNLGNAPENIAGTNPPSSSPLPPTIAIPPTRSSNAEKQSPLPPMIATPPPGFPLEENSIPDPDPDPIPDIPPLEPLVHSEPVQPDPLVSEMEMSSNSEINSPSSEPLPERGVDTSRPYTPAASASPQIMPPAAPVSPPTVAQAPIQSAPSQTMLQVQVARLLHVQTNTPIELPSNLTVIHIGKPNDRIPPDVDVSGFPNSEIVSRVHADIRVEGDSHYIEDVGSANGTYINNMPLPVGNRHRLRPGDRIALGKGDKVTFLFQIS